MENFTLLLASDIKCAKCDDTSTHVLLGKENNFLGFFCFTHGIVIKDKFEEKYQFEQEMNKGKIVMKKYKKRRRNPNK